MAYRIELGLTPEAYFYAELLIRDHNSGLPMPLAGNTQSLVAWPSDHECWGPWEPYTPPYVPPQVSSPTPAIPPTPIDAPPVNAPASFGWVLAADALGNVQYPASGVLAVFIPGSRFWPRFRRAARCGSACSPLPPTPDFACLLASGTISFEDRVMNPRITLEAYPLYPNSVVTYLTTTQWLRALSATVPSAMATLQEAIPSDPDNANRIILDNSGDARPLAVLSKR